MLSHNKKIKSKCQKIIGNFKYKEFQGSMGDQKMVLAKASVDEIARKASAERVKVQ